MRERHKFFDKNIAGVILIFGCSGKIKAQSLVELGR
jgi:hypothetical protein